MKKGEWVEESNEALRKAFRELKKKGYQNLHYLKSEHLLGEDGESTVDGEHFTDLGFDRFAKGIYPVVKNAYNAMRKDERKASSTTVKVGRRGFF